MDTLTLRIKMSDMTFKASKLGGKAFKKYADGRHTQENREQAREKHAGHRFATRVFLNEMDALEQKFRTEHGIA